MTYRCWLNRKQSWCQSLLSVYRKSYLHLALLANGMPYSPEPCHSIIAAAALRLHFLNTQIHSLNPTLDGAIAVIMTEVQIQYSIISCVICSIRPFMSAVSTNYGAAAINVEVYQTVNGPGTKGYSVSSKLRSQRSNNESYALGTANRGKRNGELESATGEEGKHKSMFRPDTYNRGTTSIGTGARRDTEDSKRSNESTKMIIRKEMEYTVEVEDQTRTAGERQ